VNGELWAVGGMVVVAVVAWAGTRSNPGTSADLIRELREYVSDLLERQEHTDEVVADLREHVARCDEENAEHRRQIGVLFESNLALTKLAARLVDVPGARPMAEFVDQKWLSALNSKVANPEGAHVAIYIDDVDGKFALGWQVVPLAEVPPEYVMHPDSLDANERILQGHIEDALAEYAASRAPFPHPDPPKE